MATDGGGKTDVVGICIILVIAFLIVTNYVLWSASSLPFHHKQRRTHPNKTEQHKHILHPMSQTPREPAKRPVSDDGTRPQKKVRFVEQPPSVQYTNEYYGTDEELKKGTLVDQATSVAKQGVYQILNAMGPVHNNNMERFIPLEITKKKQTQLDAIRQTQNSEEAYTTRVYTRHAVGKRHTTPSE